VEERWIKWEPIKDLANKYSIELISENKEGLIIVLSSHSDSKKLVKIIFKDSVDSYRSTDESLRLSSVHDFFKYSKHTLNGAWTFFKVNNSTYAQWLSEQSYGLSEPTLFTHFLLLTSDEVIDLIATYEPTVQHL
jgi:hypothetical protein